MGDGVRSSLAVSRGDLLAAAFDGAPSPALILGSDWRCVYLNAAAAQLAGRERQALLGQVFWDLFPATVGGTAWQVCHRAMEQRLIGRYDEHLAAQGTWFAVDVYPIDQGIAIQYHDVTAERRREARAEEHARRTLRLERMLREVDQLIIDGAPVENSLGVICDAVVALGYPLCWVGLAEPDHTVRPIVGAGVAQGYLATLRVRWDDSPQGRGPTGLAVRTGKASVCIDIPLDPDFEPWRQQATLHGLRSSIAMPLVTVECEVLGVLTVYREVAAGFTEEDVQAFETFAGQCAVALVSARRERGLRDAEHQLAAAQRMEAIGNLAGGIAHDFNNLLTGIVGFAEFQRERLAADPDAVGDLDQILAGAHRAAGLTRQLLTFARRQVIDRNTLDVNMVIRDLLRLLTRVVSERIRIDLDLTKDVPLVLADAGQIEQVLLNLCLNARDAMPCTGTITISTRQEVVEAEQDGGPKPGRYAVVSVRDSGLGIDAAVRDRIFEPFFTTKAPGQGTGLGLAVTYGIVKQHGGTIWFDSEVGKGSAFHFRLPAQEGATVSTTMGEQLPVVGGKECVLVAEDDAAIRVMVERALSRLGYRVLAVSDGADALALFDGRGGEVDLVLLDVVMPRLGGVPALAHMRSAKPGLRAILMSGYAQDIVLEPQVLDAGVSFLPKPFDARRLARLVREVLDAQARQA